VNPTSKKTRRILIAPIPLERPDKKPLRKDESLTFKLRNNPAEADSTTYEFTIRFFETGTPEECLDFVRDTKRVITGQNITTGPAKYALIRRLLKGDALAAFNRAATTAGNETLVNFNVAINELVTHVFPRRALITQKHCMRRFMRKPNTMTMREYMARMVEINQKLPEFPPHAADQALPQDEILDIGEFATPGSWQREMVVQDFDAMDGTVQDLVNFCERMEQTEEHDNNATEVKKSKTKDSGYKIPKKEGKSSGPWCEWCESNTHMTKDCRSLKRMKEDKNKSWRDQKRQKYSWSRKEEEKKKSGSSFQLKKEQINAMVQREVKRQVQELSAGKRKRSEEQYTAEEDEELKTGFENFSLSDNSSDNASEGQISEIDESE